MQELRIAAVVVVTCLRLATACAEQRYALVIGSNPGWSRDRPLRYAERDAEAMRDVLTSLGGFPDRQTTLLRDPSSAEVRAALHQLAALVRVVKEDTLVFVYYSGHADDQYFHIRGQHPLSHRELQEALRALPATVKLGVIDACKSGAVTQKGGAAATEFAVDIAARKLVGLVLLTSSGADELSQESHALAGSVFTHHLISGLRGAADANSDRDVTLAEVYHHAYELTRTDTATSGATQRPAFSYELEGQGDLVLTRLATGSDAQIWIPKGGSQRYLILDSHELRMIAEARSVAHRDVVVALTPGRYRIKRILDDSLEVASVDLASGVRIDISRLQYRSAPMSAGVMKGDPGGLSPTEHHEWARTQAFNVLDGGNASAALSMFDRLVRERPGDALAWRGRARALTRIAESYERVDDRAGELRARLEALKSDPALTFDPDFQARYIQLIEHEQAVASQRAEREARLRNDVRAVMRYGYGLELFSARAIIGVSRTAVLDGVLFPRIAVDLLNWSFDAGVSFALAKRHWSPYLGVGSHVSLATLGIGPDLLKQPDGEPPNELQNMFHLHLRFEAGMQFVSATGWTTELGLGVLAFRTPDGKLTSTPWPIFHVGRLF